MTLSPFLVYLWSIVENIRSVAGVTLFLSTAFSLVGTVVLFVMMEERMTAETISLFKKVLFRGCYPFMFISLVFRLFIPTQRDLAIIIVAPALVNSQPVQRDLPELYNIGIEALKESLTKDKKVEEAKNQK